jgi:hypothetical protein
MTMVLQRHTHIPRTLKRTNKYNNKIGEKQMKKLHLTLVVLIALISAIYADDVSAYLEYTLISGGTAYSVTLLSQYRDIATTVTIPDSYNSLPVTTIGNDAFENCSNLNSVTIGNNVKTINNSAFTGCTNLNSVTIPSKVWYVYYSAFRDCNSLTKVRFE